MLILVLLPVSMVQSEESPQISLAFKQCLLCVVIYGVQHHDAAAELAASSSSHKLQACELLAWSIKADFVCRKGLQQVGKPE